MDTQRFTTLNRKGYRPRIVDGTISDYLKAFGAVCIEGPRQCGKTLTGLNHAKSSIHINDPINDFNNKRLAQIDPGSVLKGETPRLIAEWQEVPLLWDAVRHKVDASGKRGMFILSGSKTPDRKDFLHSGAGRMGTVRMRTMSLYESGDSTGDISLSGLFEKPCDKDILIRDVKLDELTDLVVRGGWPAVLGMDTESAMNHSKKYMDSIIDYCVRDMDGIKRDAGKMRSLLKSLARNESKTVSNNALVRDIFNVDKEHVSRQTLSKYLDVLRKLFLIEEEPGFNPNLRSSVRVGKSPKRRFADPSLAIAALEATPDMLMNDLNTFGLLFESLCMRDLAVYVESFGGRLYHYRDSEGREIDAVVKLPDGRWGAFEVKLGADRIDEAAENLLKIDELTSRDPKSKRPSVLCVICGIMSAAYKRDDGVYVIPITALKN